MGIWGGVNCSLLLVIPLLLFLFLFFSFVETDRGTNGSRGVDARLERFPSDQA